MLLVGVTYGIKPYGSSNMGWGNPFVIGAMIAGGVAALVLFVVIELRVKDPMFELRLFRIRAFAAGNLAVLLSSIANGGLQFMLIMWLQGIWLPLHGYSYVDTPLWAGIYMLPLTVGLHGRRAGLRTPLRPLRRAAVRHRRHAAGGAELPPAHGAAGGLLLPVVRRSSCSSTASRSACSRRPTRRRS